MFLKDPNKVPSDPKMLIVIQKASKWPKKVPNEPKRFQMTKKGPKYPNYHKYYKKWIFFLKVIQKLQI